MKYRILKNTSLSVSEISLGTWQLGGASFTREGYPSGWSHTDEPLAIRAIRYAVDNGVNHFDTADCYGNGRAEQILGNASLDENIIISTKVGYIKNNFEHAYHPSNIRLQLETSLKNLRRENIDIYYFHHSNFGDNDKYLDDAMAVMQKFRDEGKIKYIGLSCYITRDFLRLMPKIKPSVLQGLANILDDKFICEGSLIRQMLEKENVSFIAFSPLAQGLLTGKYSSKNIPNFDDGDHRKNDKKFLLDFLLNLEPKIVKLRDRFGDNLDDMVRIALQYILLEDVVGCVIPGFRNLEHVKSILRDSYKLFSIDDKRYIQQIFN